MCYFFGFLDVLFPMRSIEKLEVIVFFLLEASPFNIQPTTIHLQPPSPNHLFLSFTQKAITDLFDPLFNHSITSSPLPKQQAPLDIITVRTYLTSALVRFLGDTGAGIPIDILKLEAATSDSTRPRSTAQADDPDTGPPGPRKDDDNNDHDGGHDGGADASLTRKKAHAQRSLGTCWIRVPARDQLPVTSSLTTWSSVTLPADVATSSTFPPLSSSSSSPSSAASTNPSLTWRIKAQGKFLGLLVAKGGEQKIWEY